MNIHDVINYLKNYAGPAVRLMEVCGTHTGSIFKQGIAGLISPKISLISGPGCPVCVTPADYIDRAVDYACQPEYIFCTYGDMMRVPGTKAEVTLGDGKAFGARVEMVYSPLEILEKAAALPEKIFVMGAVGFETTAPLYGLLIDKMLKQGVKNIKFLTALKTIVPAMEWVCANEGCGGEGIDGFICPGHVSAIMGEDIYQPLVHHYRKPCSIAGFSGEHILGAIYDLVNQITTGRAEVHNLYREVVKKEGNPQARALIDHYFQPVRTAWRGLGEIAGSGWGLRDIYREFDLGFESSYQEDQSLCRCGSVVTGRLRPDQCPLFGSLCTPHHPQGPCMVSPEGTCGIWAQHILRGKKNRQWAGEGDLG